LPSLLQPQSTDEWNDLAYGWKLLISYLTCLLVSWLLVWLYMRKPGIAIIAPSILIVAMAVRVIVLQPEEVIVFFPSMRPYQPAQVALIAAILGVLFYRNSSVRAKSHP
jgi:hypothetical protein